jgi:hypothetical protein
LPTVACYGLIVHRQHSGDQVIKLAGEGAAAAAAAAAQEGEECLLCLRINKMVPRLFVL